MKIVNKTKFVRTISILTLIIIACVIFCNKTYSKVEGNYKEEYICEGIPYGILLKKKRRTISILKIKILEML